LAVADAMGERQRFPRGGFGLVDPIDVDQAHGEPLQHGDLPPREADVRGHLGRA
jgi:hypothetical protein